MQIFLKGAYSIAVKKVFLSVIALLLLGVGMSVTEAAVYSTAQRPIPELLINNTVVPIEELNKGIIKVDVGDKFKIKWTNSMENRRLFSDGCSSLPSHSNVNNDFEHRFVEGDKGCVFKVFYSYRNVDNDEVKYSAVIQVGENPTRVRPSVFVVAGYAIAGAGSDASYFKPGEPVRVSWSTTHADKIEGTLSRESGYVTCQKDGVVPQVLEAAGTIMFSTSVTDADCSFVFRIKATNTKTGATESAYVSIRARDTASVPSAEEKANLVLVDGKKVTTFNGAPVNVTWTTGSAPSYLVGIPRACGIGFVNSTGSGKGTFSTNKTQNAGCEYIVVSTVEKNNRRYEDRAVIKVPLDSAGEGPNMPTLQNNNVPTLQALVNGVSGQSTYSVKVGDVVKIDWKGENIRSSSLTYQGLSSSCRSGNSVSGLSFFLLNPTQADAGCDFLITVLALNQDGILAIETFTITVEASNQTVSANLLINGKKHIETREGDTQEFAWNTTGATSAYITYTSNKPGCGGGMYLDKLSLQGTRTFPSGKGHPYEGCTLTYTLTATGPNGTKTDSVTIYILSSLHINLALVRDGNWNQNLTAKIGDTIQLFWGVKNHKNYSITYSGNCGSGNVTVPGVWSHYAHTQTIEIKPQHLGCTYVYKVVAWNNIETKESTVTLSIPRDPGNAPMPTALITANGKTSVTIKAGDPLTLDWSTTNAVSVVGSFTTTDTKPGAICPTGHSPGLSTFKGTVPEATRAFPGCTIKYKIIVTDVYGRTVSAETVVVVESLSSVTPVVVTPIAKPTISFTLDNKNEVVAKVGDAVMFNWAVTGNVTSVVGSYVGTPIDSTKPSSCISLNSPGLSKVSGTISQVTTASMQNCSYAYKIVATGPGGSTEKGVTIRTPIPVVAPISAVKQNSVPDSGSYQPTFILKSMKNKSISSIDIKADGKDSVSVYVGQKVNITWTGQNTQFLEGKVENTGVDGRSCGGSSETFNTASGTYVFDILPEYADCTAKFTITAKNSDGTTVTDSVKIKIYSNVSSMDEPLKEDQIAAIVSILKNLLTLLKDR